MIRRLAILGAAAAASVFAGHALAQEDDPGQPLRLLGEAPAIGEAGPVNFVIDARAKKGFDAGEVDVEGWFAPVTTPSAPNDAHGGELKGKCLDGHCVLTADLEDHKIVLHGDVVGASAPISGRFEVTGDLAAEKLTKGPVTFTPLTGDVPGMGALAGPDAVNSLALDDLLLWAGVDPAFGDDSAHALDDFQHEHLADWQRNNQRPAGGLLFAADLDLLKAQRDKAMKDAGWTPLSGPGWSAGYPAAVLPKASRNGAEQRFESADGKASLVIAIDPPISDKDFDALVEKLINDTEGGREHKGYVRTGSDMEISYLRAGQVISVYDYARPGGLARLVYTFPDGQSPYADMQSIITRSLRVTDDLKAAP